MAANPELSLVKVDPKEEAVVGASWAAFESGLRGLPASFDDLTNEQGIDVYRQMLTEPAVEAPFDVLRKRILGPGWRVSPAATSEDEADLAAEIAEFCTEALAGLASPLSQSLDGLLLALAYRHGLCETVLQDGTWRGRPVLTLKALKPKPRSSYAPVIDEYENVVGFTVRRPGGLALVTAGQSVDPADVYPRWKFLYLDARGSVLRTAYNAWRAKQHARVSYLRYLTRFANPIVVGKTSPSSPPTMPQLNERGEVDPARPHVSTQRQMFDQLQKLADGSVVVVPDGASVEFVYSQGDGQAFVRAFELFDREMSLGVLRYYQALHEAQHSSKASSQTAHDALSGLAKFYAEVLEDAVRSDVLSLLVRLNWGEDALRFTPRFTLRRESPPFTASELSQLFASGYLHTSQLAGLDAAFGLPPRDMEAVMAEREHEAERLARLMAEREKLDAVPPLP